MPDPILSGSNSPVSILAKIVLEHFKNASSTFSPVFALVSRNISSGNNNNNCYTGLQDITEELNRQSIDLVH